MNKTALRWLGHSLVIAAAALLAGCADEVPLGPNRRPALPAQLALVTPAEAAPDLSGCESLRVQDGSELAFHVYATGVQIYRWNGRGWSFDGPSAVLYADAERKGKVGTHYAGPRWETLSGSKVAGAFVDRCIPDPTAIPWLLLRATPEEGPGVFEGATFIQRVNTVGGQEPSHRGSFKGEVKEVPYTAEYFFYRAP